jgi:hypothetical protein
MNQANNQNKNFGDHPITNKKTYTKLIFDFDQYPIVPVTFKNKGIQTPVIESLLDSGGDFIVLPMPIASFLQLNLEPACDVDTAGGTSTLYRSNIDMLIGNQNQWILYKNQEIHVSCREDIPVLLGRNPIFNDHEITFKKRKKQLIMIPSDHQIHHSFPRDF